jgi:hypothetical protein
MSQASASTVERLPDTPLAARETLLAMVEDRPVARRFAHGDASAVGL